ncbi:RES family NAD+ phosphorylase [Marinomonas sp. TI.3.20]|uniref:RES family NAD+ phosphorylase n=1 Tax=Marinomonas sp. TI.3.20 TaxID=3121296 RepID=UPI00311D8980
MQLYRVTNDRFAANFNGKGASYEDGARWNSPGHPVIYFALDMATAMLEAANYHSSPKLIPPSHCKAMYSVEEGVSIEYLPQDDLPLNWDEMPHPSSTQSIGDDFLLRQDSLFLLVPSVGVGLQDELKIAIANPLHPEIQKISFIKSIKPVYSSRMFSGLV